MLKSCSNQAKFGISASDGGSPSRVRLLSQDPALVHSAGCKTRHLAHRATHQCVSRP